MTDEPELDSLDESVLVRGVLFLPILNRELELDDLVVGIEFASSEGPDVADIGPDDGEAGDSMFWFLLGDPLFKIEDNLGKLGIARKGD